MDLLPDELIWDIAIRLLPADICALSRTCRRLYWALKSNWIWYPVWDRCLGLRHMHLPYFPTTSYRELWKRLVWSLDLGAPDISDKLLAGKKLTTTKLITVRARLTVLLKGRLDEPLCLSLATMSGTLDGLVEKIGKLSVPTQLYLVRTAQYKPYEGVRMDSLMAALYELYLNLQNRPEVLARFLAIDSPLNTALKDKIPAFWTESLDLHGLRAKDLLEGFHRYYGQLKPVLLWLREVRPEKDLVVSFSVVNNEELARLMHQGLDYNIAEGRASSIVTGTLIDVISRRIVHSLPLLKSPAPNKSYFVYNELRSLWLLGYLEHPQLGQLVRATFKKAPRGMK